jgi:isopenicillin-N epimerase
MAMIELPITAPASREGAQKIRDTLLKHHGVQVPINAINGRYWTRISAQIYNEMEDYERLAAAMDDLTG